MGAGNYYFSSKIIFNEKLSEKYYSMVYVDEYEYFDDDYYCRDSILAEITEALKTHLKGFEAIDQSYKDSLYLSCLYNVGDAEVIGTINRMCICATTTYYGDKIALIVTPNADWQQHINDYDENDFSWDQADSSQRAIYAGAIRSIRSGGLLKEQSSVFQKIIKIIDQELHLGERLSFRAGCYLSSRYNKNLDLSRIA